MIDLRALGEGHGDGVRIPGMEIRRFLNEPEVKADDLAAAHLAKSAAYGLPQGVDAGATYFVARATPDELACAYVEAPEGGPPSMIARSNEETGGRAALEAAVRKLWSSRGEEPMSISITYWLKDWRGPLLRPATRKLKGRSRPLTAKLGSGTWEIDGLDALSVISVSRPDDDDDPFVVVAAGTLNESGWPDVANWESRIWADVMELAGHE